MLNKKTNHRKRVQKKNTILIFVPRPCYFVLCADLAQSFSLFFSLILSLLSQLRICDSHLAFFFPIDVVEER